MSMMRRRDLTQSARPNAIERAIRKLSRRVLKLEKAPVRISLAQVVVPVKKPAPMVTPTVPSVSLLYAFDWLVGADQPQTGTTPAVLKYVSGAWAIAEQPALFFNVDGASSRPYQVSRGAGLSTANALELAAPDGTGWAETYQDDATAYVFHCRDASARLWRATIPISGNTVTISRSDAGDGSDWATIDTIGNFYQLFGMAAHPSDPDVILIGGYDNDSDEPSLIVTDDGASFSKFALPTTDFSFAYAFGGFVGFTSAGRAIAVYQWADNGSLFHHVTSAYSDTPTTGGSYTEVEVLSAYLNDDGTIYDVRGDIASDDTVSVLAVREKLSNYRPALRIGVSQDGGATWAEVDNNGIEAPDMGVYNFDDYLFHPGGVRLMDDGSLHIFGRPDADEPDDHGASGYHVAADPVDLAWKATTPLTSPSWSSQSAALRTLTGQDQPAFASDAVSHA